MPLYALAVVAFAVAIVVAAGALPAGEGPAPRIGAPSEAEAKPLVKLAERIAAAPAPRGDATLVLRTHRFPADKKHGFTGADLYLDDGRYFYGITKADLRPEDIGEGVPKLERDAAIAALALPADQARRQMIAATFGPQGEPKTAPDAGEDIRMKRPKGKRRRPPRSSRWTTTASGSVPWTR